MCPGREGPMFFGEETSGYVFTHTFFLKDSQSRGFQRWYVKQQETVHMSRLRIIITMPKDVWGKARGWFIMIPFLDNYTSTMKHNIHGTSLRKISVISPCTIKM